MPLLVKSLSPLHSVWQQADVVAGPGTHVVGNNLCASVVGVRRETAADAVATDKVSQPSTLLLARSCSTLPSHGLPAA